MQFITVLIFISMLFLNNVRAATLNGFDAEIFGFLKTSAIYSSEALASYNNINLSAPTHAVAQTRSQDKTSRLSFQTQQSRIGLNLKKEAHLSAKFEFDFIDFNKSSPTTQMNPRVRVASVTYRSGNGTIVIGQDWDLFSPVSNYTFDYVGLYFMAGNVGFIKPQVQYLVDQGEWEFGGAIGIAGNNSSSTDTDLELSKSPSYALRVTKKLTKGRVGASGIYSHLTHDAYGINLFYEQAYSQISLKSEFYYGQNLSNIGTLSIGKGNSISDAKEFGGTFTVNYKLTEKQFIFGGFGLARIDNKSELTPFAISTTNVITSPGVSKNFLTRIGWEYRLSEDLSWISEISRYETTSKIQDDHYQLNLVVGLESGVQLRF